MDEIYKHHLEMLAQHKASKVKRGERQHTQSKENLKKNVEKKITTVMVGAINQLEKIFGDLWDHEGQKGKSKSEQEYAERYAMFREIMFNLGNKMIKNAHKEMDRYDILLLPYSYQINVPPESIPPEIMKQLNRMYQDHTEGEQE